MAFTFNRLVGPATRPAISFFAAIAVGSLLLSAPAQARGPEGIADVAETVIDAVVNISTKQTVSVQQGEMPQLPPGSPMEKLDRKSVV